MSALQVMEYLPPALGMLIALSGFAFLGLNRAGKIKQTAWEETITSLQRQIQTLESENRRLVEMVERLEKKLEGK